MTEPSDQTNSGVDVGVQVQHERATRRASRYRVILHNDDYTTMEFVVQVLVEFFGKTDTEATRVMLEVHHKGQGVAGTYIRDVAETKAEMVEAFARDNGHPLKCTAEPLGEPSDTTDT